MDTNHEKVLVTGASGYIALHCISELLKNGYTVKGSLRDLGKESQVRKSLESNLSVANLEFCNLDLLKDDGWDEAASDCDYLIHIASPFIPRKLKPGIFPLTPQINSPLFFIKSRRDVSF